MSVKLSSESRSLIPVLRHTACSRAQRETKVIRKVEMSERKMVRKGAQSRWTWHGVARTPLEACIITYTEKLCLALRGGKL